MTEQKVRPTRAGIDHIGMTVPDIPAAMEFFEKVFGVETTFDIMTPEAKAIIDAEDLSVALGVPEGAKITALVKIALDGGPMIELFEWKVDDQRDPVVASDLGFHHAAIYVDDIYAAAERIEAAGGKALPGGPVEMFGYEAGAGNKAWYTQTPWGATIELICYPTVMPYETEFGRVAPGRRESGTE
jgi:catechol 2,3-dioxygenase-like lactoylglutathione lyase family enzyme